MGLHEVVVIVGAMFPFITDHSFRGRGGDTAGRSGAEAPGVDGGSDPSLREGRAGAI